MQRFLKSLFLKTGILVILTSLVVVLLAPTTISAHTTSETFRYLAGTGLLCDSDPSACPAIARESGGDTLEVTGEGNLSWRFKSVSGEGILVHRNSEGDIIGRGTWKALQLLDFQNYGCGGEGVPDEFCGGKALIRVSLKPEGVDKIYTGILQVDCVIGDNIPEGAHEGVRLNVMGGPNFNEEVSGFTILIKQ